MDKTNIAVDFSIMGDYFNQEDISKKLSICPTRYWKKGDFNPKNKMFYKNTCWSLKTVYEESLDVNIQLNKIINMLLDKKDELINLQDKLNLEYGFIIIIRIEEQQTPAIYFETPVISFINDIHAEISIDLYLCS